MKDTTSYQILVVEDDANLLEWYAECLSDLYRVVAVQSGRDAIERARRKDDIDLAVIDYRLPDLSGIETMKAIKDYAPSIPVIISTAYGDEDVAVEAFRSGARDYLKKPFGISELLSKIDFFLALRNNDKKQRKNIVYDKDAGVSPGSSIPAVTLGQYRKIQQAVLFINDNYRTNIHLDDAAGMAGISPAHFSRLFKKAMGFPYQDYIVSRRIAKAQNLLRTGSLSITEIAFAVGYTDINNFGRTFKKQTGHTPTAYRNLPKSHFSDQKA
jgi:YesN/AraC family two-component response regulator